jgi:hypothetical protein
VEVGTALRAVRGTQRNTFTASPRPPPRAPHAPHQTNTGNWTANFRRTNPRTARGSRSPPTTTTAPTQTTTCRSTSPLYLLVPATCYHQSMIFHETKLTGAFIIESTKRKTNRGFFARGFLLEKEFRPARPPHAHGAGQPVIHHRTGPLRGHAYQVPPASEPIHPLYYAARSGTSLRLAPRLTDYLQHIEWSSGGKPPGAATVPTCLRTATDAQRPRRAASTSWAEFYTPGCEPGCALRRSACGHRLAATRQRASAKRTRPSALHITQNSSNGKR